MNTYEQDKAKRDALALEVKTHSDTMKRLRESFPGYTPGSLTPAGLKHTPEYQKALRGYDRAFLALQTFNNTFVKRWAGMIRAERTNR